MAGTGEHIIQKLRFELTVGDPGEAGSLQNRVSKLVTSTLEERLEELFGELAAGRHVVVERLEVDLGRLTKISLEEDLARKLSRKLGDELRSLIHGVQPKPAGHGEEARILESPDVLHLEALLHYLRTGTYPWYVSGRMQGEELEDPRKLLLDLAESHPRALKAAIRSAVEDKRVSLRLARQFGRETLLRMAALYSGAVGKAFLEVLDLTADLSRLGAGPFRPGGQIPVSVRKILATSLGWSGLENRQAGEIVRALYVAVLREMQDSGAKGGPAVLHRRVIEDLAGLSRPGAATRESTATSSFGGGELGREILRQAGAARFLQFLRNSEEDTRYEARGRWVLAESGWLEEFRALARAAGYGPMADELAEDAVSREAGRRRLAAAPLRRLRNNLAEGLAPLPESPLEGGTGTAGESGDAPTRSTGNARGPDSPVQGKEEKVQEYFVRNGGLVLLWPYLVRLFRKLELVVDQSFIDDASRSRAVHLLQYVATGSEHTWEHRMVLNKVLCGYPLEHPLPSAVDFSGSEKEEARQVVESAIDHWEALKETTAEGFREAFLNRNARLGREPSHWILQVEPEAWDVLLDRLPWGISVLKLPWMPEPIHVEWR